MSDNTFHDAPSVVVVYQSREFGHRIPGRGSGRQTRSSRRGRHPIRLGDVSEHD